MEDLIYVLIAILWIVFSVIKGRQKQIVQPEQEERPHQRTTWEQMLDELLPPEEEEEESPFEGAAPVSAANTRTEQAETRYVSPYEAYNTFDYETDSSIPEIVSLEETEDVAPVLASRIKPADLNLNSSHTYNPALLIELRRAVVYNAILERPAW